MDTLETISCLEIWHQYSINECWWFFTLYKRTYIRYNKNTEQVFLNIKIIFIWRYSDFLRRKREIVIRGDD